MREQTPLATCACGSTWITPVRTNEDVLAPRPPILPLTAERPCPGCGSTESLIKVAP